MSRSVWIIILIIFIVIAGIIAGNQARDSSDDMALPVGLNIGEKAPDFNGWQLNGELFSLIEHRGNVVLVNLFASWCAPCRQEAPHLQETYKALHQDGVVFVGINLEENKSAIQGFQDDYSITFPLLENEDGALTEIYRPLGIPTSWIINAEGIITYVHVGPMTAEMLHEGIANAKDS